MFGRKVLSAAAIAVAASAGAGALHAQEVTLKAGTFVPPSTTYGIPFRIYADHVNETGKGLVHIRIVGGPEAIPATEQANAVMAGVLDIAVLPPSCCTGQFVEADAQPLTDMTVIEQRESGAIAALSEMATEAMGAFYLTSYGADVPFHFFLTEEISSLEDLRGMRLRGQTTCKLIFDKLGVDGSAIPAPDIHTALERGAVQGYGWAPWGIGDFGWDKLTRTRVDPGFYNVIINALMNQAKFDSLTAGQQAAPTDSAAWFEDHMIEWSAQRTQEEYAAQEAAGIAVFDADRELKEMATEVHWQDLEPLSPRVVALREMLEK